MKPLAVVAGVLFLVGCDGQPPLQRPEVIDVQRGKQLYERDCQLCHGVNGRGGVLSPILENIPELKASRFRTAESIAAIILEGRGRMQGWAGMLDQEEAFDIAGYIKSGIQDVE